MAALDGLVCPNRRARAVHCAVKNPKKAACASSLPEKTLDVKSRVTAGGWAPLFLGSQTRYGQPAIVSPSIRDARDNSFCRTLRESNRNLKFP